MNKNTILICMICLGFFFGSIQAQEAVLNTGGNATGSGGTVGYSVGLSAYTTPVGASGSVAQGVQEAYQEKVLIIGPPDITIECDESTDPANTGMATSPSSCGFAPAVTYDDVSNQTATGCSQYQYSIERSWVATDACGNASPTEVQVINVVDTSPPVIASPAGATLTCFVSVPSPINNPLDFVGAGGTISDNCTAALDEFTVFSTTSNNGGTNCPGDPLIVTRTYYVQDACSNTTTGQQVFTYLASNQVPVITSVLPTCYKYCGSLANPAEDDITYTTDCSFGASVDITGPVVIGPANCPGTIYQFTYTVTDDCGQVSDSVTRDFIIGNNGPTIECLPFNLLLECGDLNNQDYFEAHSALVTANSSCELGYTISQFPTSVNNMTCNNANVVTFTVTDDCDRTATCTSVVTISDNTPPEITSTYIDGVCNEAVCGSDVNFWFNEWKAKVLEGLSATDNCDSNVSFTVSGPSSANQDCPDEIAKRYSPG